MTEMCSPASDSGKISPRCVFGRRSVAAFSLHVPEGLGRKTPSAQNISPPCIQNELASARYARRASEKPRKQPSGNTPREDLARKGPFCCARPQIMHGAQILPRPDDAEQRRGVRRTRYAAAPVAPVAPARCRSPSGTRGGVFQLMLQDQLRFPATQENVEGRRALAVVHWTKPACHQHFIDAESTAIFEHDKHKAQGGHPARTVPTRPPFRGARASFRHLSPCSPCLYTRTGVRIKTSERTLVFDVMGE